MAEATETAGAGGEAARWPEPVAAGAAGAPVPAGVREAAAQRAAATQNPRDLAAYLRLRKQKA